MSGGTSTEAGLLAAVAADFDADLPRLVLADYYDDHGKAPLARFIRAQLAVANSPPGHAHYVDALEEQALALAGVRGAALLPAPELPEGFAFVGSVDELEEDGVGEYRRGFADYARIDGNRVSLRASVLAGATKRLFESSLVRHLCLSHLGDEAADRILSAPESAQLRGLFVTAPAPGVAYQSVARNLSRGPLRRLTLFGQRGWNEVGEIARCEFPALTHFGFGGGAIDAAEWADLAHSRWAPRLESLLLASGHAAGLVGFVLAAGEQLRNLEFNVIARGTPLAPESAPPGLSRLLFRACELGEELSRRLAAWPLPPLASLVFHRCTLTQPALAALADAPWLREVEELALIDCTFDAEFLPVLLARLTPGRLRKLHLRGAELSRAAFEWLATAEVTQSLTTLDVRGARPAKSRGHAGPVAPGYLAQHFAKHWRGHRLRALLLDHWSVGTAAAKALAQNPRLASLRRLSLRGCRLSDSSGAMLLGSPHLGGVEEWGLSQNALSSATAACLLSGGCAVLAGLVDLGDNRFRPDERARLRGLRPGVWA